MDDKNVLSEDDCERIAGRLADKLKERSFEPNFYIEGEAHYLDHMRLRDFLRVFDADTMTALKDMATAFRASRSKFWSIFTKLAVIGAILMALAAIFHNPTELIKSITENKP